MSCKGLRSDGEERGWMMRQDFTGCVRVKQVIYVTRPALAKKRSMKATNVEATWSSDCPACRSFLTFLGFFTFVTKDLVSNLHFCFFRLQVSSTPSDRFVATKRTWQPSASTPSTPSWILGSSSSAASLCFATSAPCWAAASAEERWRRRHTALCLYRLTITYSATPPTWLFRRAACTPVYLCDPADTLSCAESWETLALDIQRWSKTVKWNLNICIQDFSTHQVFDNEVSVTAEILKKRGRYSFPMNSLWGKMIALSL